MRKMCRLTGSTYFVALMLALTFVQRASACSCLREHPQNHFCKSDFVAVLKVKRVSVRDEDYTAYKVKINKIFKATEKAEFALKKNLLWTPSFDSICGVLLNVGETYVVGGKVVFGKATFGTCDLYMPWASVTNRQRKGFRKLYHYGCLCEVKNTSWWRKGAVLESTAGKQCLWESSPGPEDCQTKYGVCMAGPAGCSWVPSVPYNNCIADYQRQRELQ